MASAAPAAIPEPEPADGLKDLNAASLEELNSLRGGGRIGKAIVRGRPYASVEDLVKKRVLNRSVYARIKDQVTVR
ncbi:helix-hairpin-helix domain-containing protein [Microvirga sp. SM9]|nr:helix-hairpin-helix domain-containing protein [Microvirga lenta]